jgi:hypothetical protein
MRSQLDGCDSSAVVAIHPVDVAGFNLFRCVLLPSGTSPSRSRWWCFGGETPACAHPPATPARRSLASPGRRLFSALKQVAWFSRPRCLGEFPERFQMGIARMALEGPGRQGFREATLPVDPFGRPCGASLWRSHACPASELRHGGTLQLNLSPMPLSYTGVIESPSSELALRRRAATVAPVLPFLTLQRH